MSSVVPAKAGTQFAAACRLNHRVVPAKAGTTAVCVATSLFTTRLRILATHNGFTAYGVISPTNGLIATVAPGPRWLPRRLTPPPRRQGHTLLPYPFAAFVGRDIGVHRIGSDLPRLPPSLVELRRT